MGTIYKKSVTTNVRAGPAAAKLKLEALRASGKKAGSAPSDHSPHGDPALSEILQKAGKRALGGKS